MLLSIPVTAKIGVCAPGGALGALQTFIYHLAAAMEVSFLL